MSTAIITKAEKSKVGCTKSYSKATKKTNGREREKKKKERKRKRTSGSGYNRVGTSRGNET